MKIGEFAISNNTTIDTIRHYMDLSLLTPEKNGPYYDFDEGCQKDYNTIIYLKDIGFSLSEIQTLILFERIGRYTSYNRRKTYRAFFENKKKIIDRELERLNKMKSRLQETLDSMSQEMIHADKKSGVPLDVLPYIYCKDCQSSYVLSEGNVEDGDIISGKIKCSCQNTLKIQDGILFGKGCLDPDSCADFDNDFIEEYVQTTHVDYLKNLHLSLQWARNNYDFPGSKNKVIMELGSGRGFFLRNMIDLFSDKSIYIAVDHNPNAQQWLKDSLTDVIGNKKILFLCCDFTSIPLRPESIDSLIDATGSSNYAFDHNDFLLDAIMPLLHVNSTLYGHYLAFKNFSVNSIIPTSNQKWFRKQGITEHLDSLGFEKILEYETKPISDGGPMESFFVEGEQIYNYMYIGKFIR